MSNRYIKFGEFSAEHPICCIYADRKTRFKIGYLLCKQIWITCRQSDGRLNTIGQKNLQFVESVFWHEDDINNSRCGSINVE